MYQTCLIIKHAYSKCRHDILNTGTNKFDMNPQKKASVTRTAHDVILKRDK